eukprot:scaffold210364_cov18-Tisochrysis_lutea.AAC.1
MPTVSGYISEGDVNCLISTTALADGAAYAQLYLECSLEISKARNAKRSGREQASLQLSNCFRQTDSQTAVLSFSNGSCPQPPPAMVPVDALERMHAMMQPPPCCNHNKNVSSAELTGNNFELNTLALAATAHDQADLTAQILLNRMPRVSSCQV